MKLVRAFISFLLYSNIFIALCAVALVFQTSILLSSKLPVELYALIFLATLIEYNIHRFILLVRNAEMPSEPRYHWLFENKKLFLFLFFASLLAAIPVILKLPLRIFPWLLATGMITVLYTFPVIPTTKGLKRLRAIPHMKVVTIAIVWVLTTMLLPAAYHAMVNSDLILPALIQFLFVLAITIPFDARDIVSDTRRGLKTIPIVFGVRQSYRITTWILLLIIILGFISHVSMDNYYGFSMALTSLLTILIIKREAWRSHPYYYYGLLDGTMIFAPLLNFLLSEYFVK